MQPRNFKSFSSPCGMCCIILQMTSLEVFTLMNTQLPLQIPGREGRAEALRPVSLGSKSSISSGPRWDPRCSPQQPRWLGVRQHSWGGSLSFGYSAGKKQSALAPLQAKAKGLFLLMPFLIFPSSFPTPS